MVLSESDGFSIEKNLLFFIVILTLFIARTLSYNRETLLNFIAYVIKYFSEVSDRL